MDIITAEDLASYLRDDSLASSLAQIVVLTNGLVTEEWANPAATVPTSVQLVALNVGARAWVNNPATSHLDSVTRGIDDATRTERYRSAGDGSVYLTDAEARLLHGGTRVGSVRLVQPGDE